MSKREVRATQTHAPTQAEQCKRASDSRWNAHELRKPIAIARCSNLAVAAIRLAFVPAFRTRSAESTISCGKRRDMRVNARPGFPSLTPCSVLFPLLCFSPRPPGMTYWSLLSGLDLLSSQLLVSRGHSASDVGKLKNFFGRYSDSNLKALAALVALYRDGNLFLAEGARILSQSVKYDIPLLKKSLASNLKMNEDLRTKISEESRSCREARKRLTDSLASTWHIHSLTLSPAALEAQIRSRAETELPVLLNDLITQTQQSKFAEAIEYYEQFVKFCLQAQSEGAAASSSSSGATEAAFPSLRALRAGELMPLVSASSESPSASAAAPAAASEGGIDWGISVDGSGDAAGGAAATGEIDWGITTDGAGHDGSATTVTAGSIDWGDDSSSVPAADGAAAGASIDWDIETTEAGEDSASTTSTAEALTAASPSHSTASSAVASGSASAAAAAPTSLLHDAFRHAVLAELLELESFLSERSSDLSSSGSSSSGDEASQAAFAVAGVPHILSLQSTQSVAGYLSAVRGALTALRASRLTQLLMVRSSRRFIDRLVAGIRQQLQAIERMDRASVAHEARRIELNKATQKASHELHQLLAQCRTLKSQMEGEISRLFQNRPVHLVGEINQMLQLQAAS